MASLDVRTAAGWGVGSLGVAILYNTTNLLLLRYLTDYVGIAAGLAALLIALSKIYDAITDPLMGVLSDRTRSRWGRRRPWLLIGSFLCAATLPVLFAPPDLSGPSAVAWVAFGLFFYATAYTVFSVPYMAMPAEMTDDPHERSKLIGWRVTAIAFGQLIAGAGGAALIAWGGGGKAGHAAMGWVTGAIVLFACLLCFVTTGRARSLAASTATPGWRDQIAVVTGNPAFVWLLIGKLAQLVGVSFLSATLAYFTSRVLSLPDSKLAVIFAVMTVGILIGTPLLTALSKRIGKHATYGWSAAIYVPASLSWLLATPVEAEFTLLARSFVLGVASAGMMLMAQSLLPDVMAADRARTGFAREGIYAGVYTTLEKLAYAVGIAIVGAFLQLVGYEAGATQQPPLALEGIRWAVSIAPAAFAILAYLGIRRVRV